MINKITKSKNSLKSKIYFSLIFSLLIFSLIVFFWFLGNHSNIDEKGLTTTLIILPSSLLFTLVSFITGLTLSIKRKNRKDFKYDLRLFLWITSVVFIFLLILFFYNSTLTKLAISTNSKDLCHLTISPNIQSNLFNVRFKEYCLLTISVEESKTGAITCGELANIGDKNSCYRWTSQNRRDIKICIDNVVAETEVIKYNVECTSAIRYLEEEIYNTLSNPQHPDIMYALKSTPELGIYYDEVAENKYIPLIKNIVVQGSLEAKRKSLEILFTWASQDGLEEEKIILREQILPLIENQPELQEYVTKINQRLNAVILPSSTTSNVRTN